MRAAHASNVMAARSAHPQSGNRRFTQRPSTSISPARLIRVLSVMEIERQLGFLVRYVEGTLVSKRALVAALALHRCIEGRGLFPQNSPLSYPKTRDYNSSHRSWGCRLRPSPEVGHQDKYLRPQKLERALCRRGAHNNGGRFSSWIGPNLHSLVRYTFRGIDRRLSLVHRNGGHSNR